MSIDPDPATVPKLLRRRDMSLDWDRGSAHQTEFGHQRTTYEGLAGTCMAARVAVVLFGQEAPAHSDVAEHIICHLAGDVEWTVDGMAFRPEVHDLLFIPANVVYRYINRGTDNALFLVIHGKRDEWPPRVRY
jgi:quercetin dioxygenase-like cupin family protein